MKENYYPSQLAAKEAGCGTLCLAVDPVQEGWEKPEGPLVGWQGGWGLGRAACEKGCRGVHVLDVAERGLRCNLTAGFRVLGVITKIKESNFSVV